MSKRKNLTIKYFFIKDNFTHFFFIFLILDTNYSYLDESNVREFRFIVNLKYVKN